LKGQELKTLQKRNDDLKKELLDQKCFLVIAAIKFAAQQSVFTVTIARTTDEMLLAVRDL
jgi:hypothetical protein